VSGPPMTCRDALVVLLDGPTASDAGRYRRARAHASACSQCASSYDDPEASRRVLDHAPPALPGLPPVLRGVVLGLATLQLVLACPWLFGASVVPDHNVAIAHLTRDGALGLVVACAAIVAAWRPRYLVSALLVGSVALVAQFASGLVDQQDRAVSAGFELTHTLSFAILALLAYASARLRLKPADPGGRPPTLHSL